MHFEHGILGQTGYGKTYLMNSLLRVFSRVIVIDPQDEFKNYPAVYSVTDFRHAIDRESVFRLAVQLEHIEHYTHIFSDIYNHIHNIVLAADEISLFAPTYRSDHWLKQIAQRGRKRNISLIWTTQRPANVSRDITSQALAITAFRLLEPRDVVYLSSKWKSKEGEKTLANLSKYKYLTVRGDKADLKKFYKKS